MTKKKLTFGAMMKLYRVKNGYTQVDMSNKLKVTQQVYSLYEQEKRRPNIEFVMKYKRLFNVDLTEGIEQIYFSDDRMKENITLSMEALAQENRQLKDALMKAQNQVNELEKRLAPFLQGIKNGTKKTTH